MQSLLFPEYSPTEIEQQALIQWTRSWMGRFPAMDPSDRALADGALLLRALATPLGPMLAVVGNGGLVLLEFVDEERIESQLSRARKAHRGPVIASPERAAEASAVRPPHTALLELDEVKDQVDAYFAGELMRFELRLDPTGTDFQKRVWDELVKVPFGCQTSYGKIAHAVGSPKGSRAVGAANGTNPIAIIQPCHRVVGADGTLTGYGGGLWRKRRLLELEADLMDRQA